MKCHHNYLDFVTALIVISSVLDHVCSQNSLDFNVDDNCKETIHCNDPLNVLSSDKRELNSVTSKEDMDRLCSDMMKHLECIDQKTKRCLSPEDQMTFNVLYNGTIVVMTDLCHNDTYQQEFLKHARCFNNLKNEEDCEATYSLALSDIKKSPGAGNRICCSFQEYLECSKRTVGEACGDDAGKFNNRMLDTMTASLKEQCQPYSLASEECRAMSLASRTSVGAVTCRAHLLTLLVAVLTLGVLMRTRHL